MTISTSTRGLLALWLIPGLGPRRINRLWNHFGCIENIVGASPENLAKVLGLSSKITRRIPKALNAELYLEELRLLKKHGIGILDFSQAEYPELLRETYDAPPIIYKRGDIDFNGGMYIAFVGSRKASFAGKTICRKLIKRLAELNSEIVIVSGLALGIDSTAHEAALDVGLKTVSVLAGGLSSIYPAQNSKLSERIADNGALITEFPVNTRPAAINFPLRNRIISGISKGVVVVEAGERSGASITAGYALEQNRELFALPGLADSKFYVGTNRLIQKGQAKLVMKAEDILEEIQSDYVSQTKDNTSMVSDDCSENLTNDEKAVLKILEKGSAHQDNLANELNMPVHQLLATLTMLDLKGCIVSKPGSIYQAVQK